MFFDRQLINSQKSSNELDRFLKFRSVSASTKHAVDTRNCAAWLTTRLHSIGLERASVLPTPGHPVVYAEWRHAHGKPTVLIYGHYDVQPADPLDEWHSPPFTPTIRGDYLYGRGASDDKGQLFIHIKAIESLLKTYGKLPVNVVCLFEGEEEIGSPNLGAFIRKHRQRLAADFTVISDTQIPAANRPAITHSLRGALAVELTVFGPERDLHSGLLGGAAVNPLQALSQMIAGLHDANGRVAIPGFYDRVQRFDAQERAYMKRVGPSDAQLLRSAGATLGLGEPNYSLYERTTIRPALTVTGITGGYQGAGIKAVIPTKASAKLDIRLVPGQQPKEIEALLRKHLKRITPAGVRVRLRTLLSARPVSMNRSHPAMLAAATAYRSAFGVEPIFLRSGGTIPVVGLIQDILNIPVVLMGFGLPDDHIHGPNERLHLPTFFRGIETSKRFLIEVGKMSRVQENLL